MNTFARRGITDTLLNRWHIHKYMPLAAKLGDRDKLCWRAIACKGRRDPRHRSRRPAAMATRRSPKPPVC